MIQTRKMLRRLCFSLLFCLFISTATFADDSVDVHFRAIYGQTEARSMLQMINQFRTGSDAWYWNSTDTQKIICTGLAPLVYDYDLEQTAMQRAKEIALYYSHTRPNGSRCFTAYPDKFYYGMGENIAYGYSSAEEVFTAWQETNCTYSGQGHRRNMLDAEFNMVAIGHVTYNGIDYWVQEFADGPINTTATAAVNGEDLMNVTLNSDLISGVSFRFASRNYSIPFEDNISAPSATVLLSTSGGYYNRNMPVLLPVSYSIEDSTIVSYTDNTLTGNRVGQTYFQTTCLGYQGSLPILVTPLDIANAAVSLSETVCSYNGNAQTPSVTSVRMNGKTLTAGTDYDVSYHNNSVPGTATVTITGNGNYTGNKTISYEIVCYHGRTAIDAAISATCTTTGLTEGSHCTICNEILVPQRTTNALGHSSVTDPAVPATCTTTGLTQGSHCSVCDVILTPQRTTNALGHSSVTDPAVPATCTTTGLTQGSHCSVCDVILTPQRTTNALGHSSVTDPAVPATCTSTGLTQGSHCSVCDAILTAQRTTNALGHFSVTDTAVPATCTSTGLTQGSHCSVCDAILTPQRTTDALGHSSVTDPAAPATCTSTGLTQGSHCSVCDAILTPQRTTNALGHSSVTDPAVPATCTSTGLTQGSHCSVCDVILTPQRTTDALGHNIEIYKTTPATTKSAGTIFSHCSTCEQEESQVTIPRIKNIQLSQSTFIYNQKMQKPSVVLKDTNGNAIPTEYYSVTYASGRKKVGTYSVKINFKGNYTGTVTKSFKILPKSTSISGLTDLSKGFTVKIAKQAAQTTGYEIQYSLKSNFANSKNEILTKNTILNKKITKLKPNKKYYVRVRTYKTVNGTNYYSAWSSALTITTRK